MRCIVIILLVSFAGCLPNRDVEGTRHDPGKQIDDPDVLEARSRSNQIIVRSVRPDEKPVPGGRTFVVNYGLTYSDYEHFRKLPRVKWVLPLRTHLAEVRCEDRKANSHVVATTATYPTVCDIEGHLEQGRFFTEQEEIDKADVAVLGAESARQLFPGEEPLGKLVEIRGAQYKVIGVMKGRRASRCLGELEKYDEDAYVPLDTHQARAGDTIFIRKAEGRTGEKVALHQIIAVLESTEFVPRAAAAVRDYLYKVHPRGDTEVRVPLESLKNQLPK